MSSPRQIRNEEGNYDFGNIVVADAELAVDAAADVDADNAEAVVVDAPVVDAPVADAPVVDAPVVDAPVVDAPEASPGLSEK